MANMASVDKTELSVRVRNEVFVVINRMANERNVTRSELVVDWLEKMTWERTRDLDHEGMIQVRALRDKHVRERRDFVRKLKAMKRAKQDEKRKCSINTGTKCGRRRRSAAWGARSPSRSMRLVTRRP